LKLWGLYKISHYNEGELPFLYRFGGGGLAAANGGSNNHQTRGPSIWVIGLNHHSLENPSL
jgi:hypothetical protein